eukprot:CAMPEP_0114487490 /NCGR_PEP_ID=MMETSP0109-20121206/796_1 /TAXON_ID=29199 /ORGANISM="Chlorarachnion reptans, Strain CCCM449" /LENGTH=76 /DNA_ID=CAMNT_0001663763 /DNA_START=1258 /DNA_END=1485 /DNA_ORIENTATION=+
MEEKCWEDAGEYLNKYEDNCTYKTNDEYVSASVPLNTSYKSKGDPKYNYDWHRFDVDNEDIVSEEFEGDAGTCSTW